MKKFIEPWSYPLEFAPPWAKFFATDANGAIRCYEVEPLIYEGAACFIMDDEHRQAHMGIAPANWPRSDWRDSLREIK